MLLVVMNVVIKCCSKVVCVSRCFSILLAAFLLVWYIKKKLVLRAYMRVSLQ